MLLLWLVELMAYGHELEQHAVGKEVDNRIVQQRECCGLLGCAMC